MRPSKAAIARLTENMAAELADDGVRINCVAPGFVATDIHNTTLAAGPELAGAGYFERTRSELEQRWDARLRGGRACLHAVGR